jgi:hypothetical protein
MKEINITFHRENGIIQTCWDAELIIIIPITLLDTNSEISKQMTKEYEFR